MALKPTRTNAHIWAGVWREKGGWAYKVENREHWNVWESHGFETRTAALESLNEVLKSMKVEL